MNRYQKGTLLFILCLLFQAGAWAQSDSLNIDLNFPQTDSISSSIDEGQDVLDSLQFKATSAIDNAQDSLNQVVGKVQDGVTKYTQMPLEAMRKSLADRRAKIDSATTDSTQKLNAWEDSIQQKMEFAHKLTNTKLPGLPANDFSDKLNLPTGTIPDFEFDTELLGDLQLPKIETFSLPSLDGLSIESLDQLDVSQLSADLDMPSFDQYSEYADYLKFDSAAVAKATAQVEQEVETRLTSEMEKQVGQSLPTNAQSPEDLMLSEQAALEQQYLQQIEEIRAKVKAEKLQKRYERAKMMTDPKTWANAATEEALKQLPIDIPDAEIKKGMKDLAKKKKQLALKFNEDTPLKDRLTVSLFTDFYNFDFDEMKF